MKHRVPALRICFISVVGWSVAALGNSWLLIVPIAASLYGLLLLSPLADYLENKER